MKPWSLYWGLYFSKQFLRFLAVGGIAAAVHWLSRIVLSSFFSFPLAVVIAYGIGMLTAFVLFRRFVFPGTDRPIGYQARWFLAISLLSFPPVWASAILLARYVLPSLGMTSHVEATAHAIAICLPAFINFLAHKFITFDRPILAAGLSR